MISIVEWLIRQGSMAANLYDDASLLFKEDKKFAQFLTALSEYEAWHCRTLVSGLDYLKDESPQIFSVISLDDKTRSDFEAPFVELRAMMDAGILGKEDLLDCIASSECREWSGVFIYAINVLKEKSGEFRFVASRIEQHKKHIKAYLETLKYDSEHLDKIRQLPEIWKHKILVVEDYEPIRELLSAIFHDEGTVHKAASGKEGLAKMKGEYYDLIISEVDMPGMSGIDFYREAALQFGCLANRFLFYVGFPEPETVEFLEKNKLKYLLKPTPVDAMKAAAHEMLLNRSRVSAA